MSFNLFASPTKDDIRVGYIDPTLGYVDSVTICEANDYAKDNPGTTFIFRNGNNSLKYLSINEVNGLTPKDLVTSQGECGGIQVYKECGPPRIQFFGGGGIGASGNPIIGRDGSLLAIDVVTGGHGYQYAPIVAAKDDCQFGNGSVLKAILGETADQVEVYEGEEDFELYELCEDTDVGYGIRYGPNGEELGPWEPQTYTKIGEDPIKREIEIYQKQLEKPFWTTRKSLPDRINVSDKTQKITYSDVYNVTDKKLVQLQEDAGVNKPVRWSEFMNNYAISPVKPSNLVGSDRAGITFSMEWEFNFPISGEYIFRGVCDNKADLYIDNVKVSKLNSGVVLGNGVSGKLNQIQKTIQSGNHILRIDLTNAPNIETVTTTNTVTTSTPNYADVNFNVYTLQKSSFASTFRIPDLGIEVQKSSNQILNVNVPKKVEVGKVYIAEIEVPRSKRVTLKISGQSLIMEDLKTSSQRDLFVTIKNGRFFDVVNGKTKSTCKFIVDGEASSTSTSTFTTTSQVVSAKSWNENPMGVSMTIDAPLPIIPQEPLPVQTGRCPPNPIWTTRFPNSTQKWYPVRNPTDPNTSEEVLWSKFMNRYAISPVLPLNTPGSDTSGVTFSNSWQIDLPYAGYYGVKGTRDNNGRILIDGKEISKLDEFSSNNPKLTKVFLTKGAHTITVEVLNSLVETKSTIDTKIFNTQDWQFSLKKSVAVVVTADVDFNVTGPKSASYASTFRIPDLGIEVSRPSKTAINQTISKKVEVGKVYIAEIEVPRSKSVTLKISGQSLIMEDLKTSSTRDLYCNVSKGRFFDVVNGKTKATCKFIVDGEAPKSEEVSNTKISKGSVTYAGPEIFKYRNNAWGNFMNNYSISPLVFSDINSADDRVVGKYTMTWKNVNFPQDGVYKFNFQADSVGVLKIGGRKIISVTDFKGQPVQHTFNITKGKYEISIEVDNLGDPTYLTTIGANPYIFSTNPMAVALYISKDIIFTDTNKTPWTINPMAVSAILIPPPCAKKIGGKGVVDRVIVEDPGNGYLAPQGSGYPATLILDQVIVEDPGINYRCGEDQIQITPNNGAQLDYDCDPFGKIKSVQVLNPGVGFDIYPEIRMVSPTGSPTGPTGVNASFRPVFRVIRDPLLPPDKLIQVTDLVGLKQTGYIEGRPYYGAIYYDEGIPYAGYYKTAGTQIRIYDTLQESITAIVTTPASAIQRSGTDIRSNDPRLNIPGTPESTTEQ